MLANRLWNQNDKSGERYKQSATREALACVHRRGKDSLVLGNLLEYLLA